MTYNICDSRLIESLRKIPLLKQTEVIRSTLRAWINNSSNKTHQEETVWCHDYYSIDEKYTKNDFEYAQQQARRFPYVANSRIMLKPFIYARRFDYWMYQNLKYRLAKDKIEYKERMSRPSRLRAGWLK